MMTTFSAVTRVGVVLCFAVWWMLMAGCGETTRPTATAKSIPLYEVFVMTLQVARAGNPFDPDEVAVEVLVRHASGRQIVLPAFWYQDYSYSVSDDKKTEAFAPVGKPAFVARFAAREKGRHEYRWRIRQGKTTEEKPGGTFIVTDARSDGPVVRGTSKRYFQLASGAPLFLIGQNVGWSRRPAPFSDMLKYIDVLADSGQNFARTWLCTWCFGFEHEKVGEYDLARAWQLDRFLEHAKKRGVYVMLCMENAHDLQTKDSPYWQTPARPSGLIAKPEEFYTDPQARRAFRNRLRYAAARWGYSNALLAWELFNEMEYTLLGPLEMNSAVRDRYFKPWLHEMAAHLKKSDAHGHLVTNSIATDRVWDEMNRFDWMDIAQHHTYLTQWDTDGAGKVIWALEWISDYGKPYLLSEFGGAPAGVYGQTKNVVHETDRAGVHIHNSLWAAAMTGAAGTALNWWWDEFIRPNDLYHHYAALSRFLQGTPWLDMELRPKDLSTETVRIRLLQGKNWVRLWAQNREFTWERSGKLDTITATEPVTIRIEDLPRGPYGVEWWDTHKGEATRTEIRASAGTLELTIPPLKRDIAARIALSRTDRPGKKPQ